MDLNLEIFKITSNNVKPEKGKLLIAEPFLKGFYFSRSIILLTEHNNEGSMGIVLNKPLDLRLKKLIGDSCLYDAEVSCGGPVSPDKLFYLHSIEELPGAMHIVDDIYFGGDFDVLSHILTESPDKLERVRFFIGYSGWSQGQLSEEIKGNSWLVSDSTIEWPRVGKRGLWKKILSDMGEKYSLWVNYPRNPELN